MKRRLALVAFVLGLACRATPSEPPPASRRSTPPPEPSGIADDVVATVDDVVIRKAEVDIAYAQLLRYQIESETAAGPGRDQANRADVLDAVIYSTLLRLECEARGLSDQALFGRPVSDDPELGLALDDLREGVLAEAMGLLTISDAELSAAYERQKSEWTGAQPWLAVDMARALWLERTGVDECDLYISQYHRCVLERVPEVARAPMNEALAESVRAWAEAAKSSGPESLTVACSAARDAAREATEPMGCSWPASDKVNAAIFGKPSARKLAGTLRERVSRPGADFAAEAGALGLARADEPAPLQADSLASPIAAAVKKLKVGEVSHAIEHDGAFWIVRLTQRWPPGALPFEARRASLELELVKERRKNVRGELEKRLRAAHRVVVTPTR